MTREPAIIVGAGVVCLRNDEVLLVRRASGMRQGEWSIPGGKVEYGETVRAAAQRELREETGVDAELLALLDVVDAIQPARQTHTGHHYVLVNFAARWRAGEPHPGDDAAAAEFVTITEALKRLEWSETRRVVIAAHNVNTAQIR